MFEISNLTCFRGDRALFSQLDFTLNQGELLHLKGHNGSGKTTLIRTLCGLLEAAEGTILWHDNPIQNNSDYFQNLLYLGHKNAIKDDLDCVENLQFNCALSGHSINEKKALQALKKIGLKGHESLFAKVLSQGQQRRLALARLLLSKQSLWILDEPLTALDKAAIALLEATISQHLKQQGMVILTTHQDTLIPQQNIKTLELGWKEAGNV